MKFFSALTFLTICLASSAMASTPRTPANVPMPDLSHCAALDQEASYADHGVASGYKFLVPGSDGWLFRSNTDFRQDFTLSEETKASLHQLRAALAAKNIQMVISVQPTRGIMGAGALNMHNPHVGDFDPAKAEASFKKMLQDMHDIGFTVADLTTGPRGRDFFYRRDIHWTPNGADFAAKTVADAVRSLSVFSTIPHVNFTTVEKDHELYSGPMAEAASKACHVAVPSDEYVATETEATDVAAGGDSLFGDEKPVDVVVVGTSNSNMHSNFVGRLKDYLDVDVQNVAISGGGYDASLLAYFASAQYKDHPPKVIVWELPGHYDINKSDFFRQLLPAIYGDCAGSSLADSGAVTLNDFRVDVLHDLENKSIPVASAYLHLNYGAPERKSFTMTWEDSANGRGRFRFKRTNRYPFDGIYFYQMNGTPEAMLSKVTLTIPQEMKGLTVTARVCAVPGSATAAPSWSHRLSDWWNK